MGNKCVYLGFLSISAGGYWVIPILPYVLKYKYTMFLKKLVWLIECHYSKYIFVPYFASFVIEEMHIKFSV